MMPHNLDAAEVKCTRKAHSRTANMRCLQDPAGEPYKHALVVDAPKNDNQTTQADECSYCIPTGENPDRNYRDHVATAPYFIDWTRSSFKQERYARD